MDEMLKLNEAQFAKREQKHGYRKGLLYLKDGTEMMAIGRQDASGNLTCCLITGMNAFSIPVLYLNTGVKTHSVYSQAGNVIVECLGLYFPASQIEEWRIDSSIGYKTIFDFELAALLKSEGYSMDNDTKTFKRDLMADVCLDNQELLSMWREANRCFLELNHYPLDRPAFITGVQVGFRKAYEKDNVQ